MTGTLVQFVVDRPCPGLPLSGTGTRMAEIRSELFPFPLWVEFPSCGPCRLCGKPTYVITEESKREAEAMFGVTSEGRPRSACESMGQVIE